MSPSPRPMARRARRTARSSARRARRTRRTRRTPRAGRRTASRPAPRTDLVAAVDLGSNSFHMVVARMVGGQPHVLDRLRERVVLAAGLDKHKKLSAEVQEKALAVLRRF